MEMSVLILNLLNSVEVNYEHYLLKHVMIFRLNIKVNTIYNKSSGFKLIEVINIIVIL